MTHKNLLFTKYDKNLLRVGKEALIFERSDKLYLLL